MFGTAAEPRGVDGERLWLGADGWLWLDIRLPLTPRFLLLCPKSAPVNWLWDTGALPRDVGAVCTACPSDVRALDVIARRRRPGLQRVRLPLSKAESVLLKRLEAAVDLEGLLGPDSCSILRGGYKIELEGAINPTIHGPEHVRWVLRHLRAASREAT